MALAATAVFEIQTGGNDTNGGGFNSVAAGTDYSQVAAKRTGTGANDSTTDLVTNGTTTVTSATAAFTSAIVGNIIYIQGGTGAIVAGRYQVNTFTNATTIVVDRSTGLTAGTGATMNVGGAVLTPGILGSTTATIPVAGNRIFIKAGTYVQTSTSANVSGGRFSSGLNIYIEGYQTTRGDLGTPPLLQADGVITTFSMMTLTGGTSVLKNVNFDGNNRTSSKGLDVAQTYFYKCKFSNFTNTAITGSSTAYAYFCEVTGCSAQPAFTNINCYYCYAHDNTSTPFNNSSSLTYVRCIADTNTGATTDGFNFAGTVGEYINCVAYLNGRDGFRLGAVNARCVNCAAEDNVGVGFNNTTNFANVQFINCAAFSNATDFTIGTSTFSINQGSITYSSSAFTNPGSGDFSLNDTSGGGADLRAAGFPPLFPAGLTTGYLDIGAAQHDDPTPGGGGETSHVF